MYLSTKNIGKNNISDYIIQKHKDVFGMLEGAWKSRWSKRNSLKTFISETWCNGDYKWGIRMEL